MEHTSNLREDIYRRRPTGGQGDPNTSETNIDRGRTPGSGVDSRDSMGTTHRLYLEVWPNIKDNFFKVLEICIKNVLTKDRR